MYGTMSVRNGVDQLRELRRGTIVWHVNLEALLVRLALGSLTRGVVVVRGVTKRFEYRALIVLGRCRRGGGGHDQGSYGLCAFETRIAAR